MTISRKPHAWIDDLAAAALSALPRVSRWPRRATDLLTASAVGTLAYTLVTRYKLAVTLLTERDELNASAAWFDYRCCLRERRRTMTPLFCVGWVEAG